MKNLLSSRWRGRAMILAGAFWVLAYFFARGVLEADVDGWLRVLVAILPILPFGGFLYLVVSGLPSMDELHRQVQLEAFAFAFPLAMVLLMVVGLIGQALDLAPERHVWYYLPVCYFAGVALAWRRYR